MDDTLHMEAVRRMYALRFPKINTKSLALQQIRGMEGIRVRKAYELAAKTTGLTWNKRTYKGNDWDASDPINQALSEANALLYGLCHAAIVSLGYSPGLGFVHTGKQLSFVYDIADLYKAETTIPTAFQSVKKGGDVSRNIRIGCRDAFARVRLLSRIADDIAFILRAESEEQPDNAIRPGDLWEEEGNRAEGGRNYGSDGEDI